MVINFGIIFAVVCIIGGILIILCCQPYWWLMKKKGMPNYYKWYFRIPGILLMLFGLFIIVLCVINSFITK